MPYKFVDMSSLINAQKKIETDLEKLETIIGKTTNQEHLLKINEKKTELQNKLQQLLPLYERFCSLAIAQNLEMNEFIEKNHQIAKDQIDKAVKDVAEVEEGKKEAAVVLKNFDIYEKYIGGLASQVDTQSNDLTKALVEYRSDGWLLALRRLDAAISDRKKAERLGSINENTNAKAVQTRIGEYKVRLGVLRKRLEAAATGGAKLTDLANEIKQLHERAEKECKELLDQLEKVGKSLREDCFKISRCKNHAAAEKALPNYATTIPLRADKIPSVIKNVKGKLKTLGLEKDGLAQGAKDHKPLATVIKALETLLQETYDKAEECEKEGIASNELVKTLSKKK